MSSCVRSHLFASGEDASYELDLREKLHGAYLQNIAPREVGDNTQMDGGAKKQKRAVGVGLFLACGFHIWTSLWVGCLRGRGLSSEYKGVLLEPRDRQGPTVIKE